MGNICAVGTKISYQITDEDIDSMIRYLLSEANEDYLLAACLCWLLTNRFIVNNNNYKVTKKTFSVAIRAHSKSLDPTRLPGGQRYVCWPKTPAQLQKAEYINSVPIEEIDKNYVKIVDLWQKGLLPNPIPMAVEFITPNRAGDYRKRGMIGLMKQGRELVFDPKGRGTRSNAKRNKAFYATERTTKWKDERVFILGEQKASDSTVEDVKALLVREGICL